MCGILAFFSKSGGLDAAACRRALSTMTWRGPDFALGRVWEDRLFLGQTVLSITGEPPAGRGDYLRSRSGRYELLFNGEVYNFEALASRHLTPRGLGARYGTDTEVLANLHEALSPAEVPALLDGMFAYALFDREARQLTLARDVQGEKSLYVYEDARGVAVASEIRAILALVPKIAPDRQALRDYFRTRHLMLLGRTVWPGVREIAPGHLETLDLETGKWSETRVAGLRDWVDPRRVEDNARRPVESLVDELDALLARTVREMLPRGRRYAAVVSGGVDSSLLAHYVIRQGSPDLLVAVDHVGKDRLSADLAPFERALGRPIETLRVDAAAYAAEIGRCQEACGAPLHTHSFVPQSQQSARVRARGCRVLLGGEGADELFGGYEAYLAPAAPARFSPSPYTRRERMPVRFSDDAPERFEDDLAAAWTEALDAYRFVDDPAERTAQAMMYADAVVQLPAVGLRGADLMSMMWSVETRSVYIRRPLVEFALNLPARLKADPAAGDPLLRAKPLLKRLFVRHYGRALLAEKQGFGGFPNEAAAWLGDPRDYVAPAWLGVEPSSLEAAWADRATAWKLINVEYFLRRWA